MQTDVVLINEVERRFEIMLQSRGRYPSNEQDALEVLLERLLTRPKELSRRLRG